MLMLKISIAVLFGLLILLFFFWLAERRKNLNMQIQLEHQRAELITQAQDRAQQMFEQQRDNLEESFQEKYESKLAKWKQDMEKRIRDDALQKSRIGIKARVTEQMVPFLSDFPYNTSDARFLGNPIDYVIFDGYTEAKDAGAPEIREIVFVDVKRGKSSLTDVQRLIKGAVEAGNVRWETIRIKDSITIRSSEDLISEKGCKGDLGRQAYLLGESGDPDAIPKLMELTQNENDNVRRLAASALGKLAGRRPQIFEAVSNLVDLLSDEKPQVRQYAAKALGRIGDTEALTALTESVNDSVDYVSEAAKKASARLSRRREIENI